MSEFAVGDKVVPRKALVMPEHPCRWTSDMDAYDGETCTIADILSRWSSPVYRLSEHSEPYCTLLPSAEDGVQEIYTIEEDGGVHEWHGHWLEAAE